LAAIAPPVGPKSAFSRRPFQLAAKNRKKKIQAIYRTSGVPNTGKAIEIAKEKARALNSRITGVETEKTGPMNRAVAPVSGGSTPHQKASSKPSEMRARAHAR
jgi:hypothetical protein